MVTLIYSRFNSVVTQIPDRQAADPGRRSKPADDRRARSTNTSRTRRPSSPTLLPQNITVQLLSAMLENQAGFFASQMAAMDNATRNAGDMIDALTINMNRTRQAQITKELIEIISGAAAALDRDVAKP